MHPVNGGLRLLLEIAALVAMGFWGWSLMDGPVSIVPAIAIPVVAAALWGTFAVPDDPSRSGNAPVPVPGVVRLVLELAIFGMGVWSVYALGFAIVSLGFGVVVVAHYLASYSRIRWLVTR